MHARVAPAVRVLAVLAPYLAWLAGPPDARAGDLLVAVTRTASTGERPFLEVRSTATGAIAVELRRVNRPDQVFAGARDLTRPEEVERALAAYAERTRAAPTRDLDLLAVARQQIAYATAGARERIGFDPLGAGLYVAEVRQGGLATRALLLVSDLALVTKRDAGGLLVWVVDRARGTPRAGVAVRARDAGGAAPAASTGPDGLARLPGSFAPEVTVEAQDQAHWAFGSERWFPADVPARRVFLVSHQPAYRPGERVEVRGVVRAVDVEGHPILDPGVGAARLWFVGPGERVLGHQDVLLSDLGTLAGGFDLPPDAPTGPCEARLELDGRRYAAPFLVDAYRMPPFEVRATSSAPRVLAGQKVAFHVAATGYDGSILPGAPVAWSLVHHRVDRELFDGDEFARLFFGSEREAFAPVTLTTGKGTLDAAGRLDVEALAPAGAEDGFLTLQVTVVGPSGLHVAGSGTCGVSSREILVALRTDRHLYGPEDLAHVTIRAQRADGQPAQAFAGTLEAAREGGAPPRGGTAFVTDERGEARLDVGLTQAGRWTLTVGSATTPGALAQRSVWVVGEDATLGYAGERLDVIADKDDYAPGETARLLVLCPWKQRPLLATLEGGTLLDARVLTPVGDALLYTIALTDAHVPNVWATFVGIDQGNLVVGSRLLRLPPVTRRLLTTVTPDAGELAPGATSGATLEVRDAAGRPVAGAEVSLAVVDEALHALFPPTGASIEAFFHPLRRCSVATGGPVHLATLGHAHVDEPAPAKHAGAGGRAQGLPPAAPAPRPAEAAPGADPEPAREAAEGGELQERARDLSGGKKDDAGAEPEATAARADFRSCVFWAPALRTGPDGRVRAEGVRYADTLTRWRLTALAVDGTTRVGTGRAEVRTKRDLEIEVALPRFLRVNDRVDAPVLVTNLTDREVEGSAHAAWGMAPPGDEGGLGPTLRLPPGVAVLGGALAPHPTAAGTLHVLARALAGALRDALARTLPVLPQGIETTSGISAEAEETGPGTGRAAVSLPIPKDLDRATFRATLSIEPTVLAAVERALPYLVGYPHGCTEQTLSRFEPLLIVTETVEALHLPLRGVLAETPRRVSAGVERLAALQHADGGFGWWPSDASDVEMTARAVRGLTRALAIPAVAERAQALRERALAYLLARAQPGERGPEARAALEALARAGALPDEAAPRLATLLALDDGRRGPPDPLERAALLEAALGAPHADLGRPALAALTALAVRDGSEVHFGPDLGARGPVQRDEDAIESTAVALRALWAAGQRGPDMDGGVRWLLRRRVGGEVWRSTRDTAAAVEFLAAYAREQAQGQEPGPYTLVWGAVRSQVPARGAVSVDVTPGDRGGEAVSLAVEGQGLFGVNLTLSGFAVGPAIAGREAGFRVERRFTRLDPVEQGGRVTYARTPVTETTTAGALLECELLVTTDRARDYVQVTSPYAAGFEPERERAQEVPGRVPALPAETERFDDRVEFFVARMPPGTHVFRHLARATFAGMFTVLPARARLMYFPEVGGSSRGEVLEITARPQEGGGR